MCIDVLRENIQRNDMAKANVMYFWYISLVFFGGTQRFSVVLSLSRLLSHSFALSFFHFLYFSVFFFLSLYACVLRTLVIVTVTVTAAVTGCVVIVVGMLVVFAKNRLLEMISCFTKNLLQLLTRDKVIQRQKSENVESIFTFGRERLEKTMNQRRKLY